MKVLATAYAVNPYEGSESGMGWNFVLQIARFQKVAVVTRKNNRGDIEKYMASNPEPVYENIDFHYYDLPYWMRFWKRGGRGAMLYFYLWQMFMPLFIKRQKIRFDLAHNLNFHNDWTPSFLWILGKPLVWGPVGHHPKIPKIFINDKKTLIVDRLRWAIKNVFWRLDPFLRLASSKADKVLVMNSQAAKMLPIPERNKVKVPSVSTEYKPWYQKPKEASFNVLSVGRFVPLKGFDITIRSFAAFYHSQEPNSQKNLKLTLVGDGPEKDYLHKLIDDLNIRSAVEVIDWIERKQLDEIYKQAHVFLFPSHEGAGMVVAEALCQGLPVLCFDNEGPGEFINQRCGYKIPYNDVEQAVDQFKKKLSNLFQSRSLLVEMSYAARLRFETRFDWKVRGRELRTIYEDSLKYGDRHKKVVCVQSRNDFSGSPKVLSRIIKILRHQGFSIDLYTSNLQEKGFLSDLEGVKYFKIRYFRSNIKLFTIFNFFFGHILSFFQLLKYRKQDVVFYVNAVLPFGALLAGKLMGKKVICHVHETTITPKFFKTFLMKIAKWCSSEVVYVSKYINDEEPFFGAPNHIIYNTLSPDFQQRAFNCAYDIQPEKSLNILMLCSLKEYKGVNEFMMLAEKLLHMKFHLVLSASTVEIKEYFKDRILPYNVSLYPVQSDVHPFYEKADVVINLSHPEKWVETFGLTILEAMSYGIPVIVPEVGGVTELVDHGWNGYQIDVRKIDEIVLALEELGTNPSKRMDLSINARAKAQEFRAEEMEKRILKLVG